MLKSHSIGNYNLGIQLVIRNLMSQKYPERRYIRLILKLLGYRFIFELRFRNSI